MITAQVESYRLCLPELKAIYPQHWAELNIDQSVPLDPNYLAYDTLDQAGTLLLVTLRNEAKRLVGYFIGFLFPELHYKSITSCFADIFYVVPEYRKGWAGVRLFRKVEAVLRERGIRRWFVGSKVHFDSGPLLRRLGFSMIETHYCKRLA